MLSYYCRFTANHMAEENFNPAYFRRPMANPRVILHIISEKNSKIDLIKLGLSDERYSLSIMPDADEELHIGEGAIDIAFFQPSFVDWKWLDALIKVKQNHPELLVFLYSQEIGLIDGIISSLKDKFIFSSNELRQLKERIIMIVDEDESSRKKVLLVDDDQNILNSYVRALRKTHWEIITATGGEKALEILGEKHVDLVLTDIKMPQMHGIELVAKIREQDKHIPIIVCSAYKGLKDDHNLKLHGGTVFVEKPVDADVLRSKIEEMLIE